MKKRCLHIHGGWAAGPRKGLRRLVPTTLLIITAALCSFSPLSAQEEQSAAPVVAPAHIQRIFPGATDVGPLGGEPPVSLIFRDGAHVGYAFSTLDLIQSTGFSGHPLDIVAGIDLSGTIRGAWLRDHTEPILVTGISDADLRDFTGAFAGLDIREAGREDPAVPDALSGATTSSAVITDAIMRSARLVAQAYGLTGPAGETGGLPDTVNYQPLGWQELLNSGAVRNLNLDWGEVRAEFSSAGHADISGAGTLRPDTLFIDLYTALVTPVSIGRNLIEPLEYTRLMAALGIGDSAVLIAANGLYSFKGTGYVRSGRFERLQIVQGSRRISLATDDYRNLQDIVTPVGEAPEFRELGIFTIKAESGFDPLRPWRLELLIERRDPSGEPVSVIAGVDYSLPERFVMTPRAAPSPADATGDALWRVRWSEQSVNIIFVSIVLTALTVLLLFQDFLARHKRLYFRVRIGFLVLVLVWLGWIVGAQLSVVNVLAFLTVLRTEFHWEFFLIDPLAFILWSFVAVTLLFWARGVFCGWLCPFGALQELLNKAARKLKIPQIRVPFGLHERLWPIKYVVFLALFAVSLYSIGLAIIGSEVEPFKTAITLRFQRFWPYVAYAGGLLFVGLFIERFFCRYLCPLGAALAIPARLRMFDWLKRRPQCGVGCHICAEQCTVQAIHPDGRINPNECIHCLHCQTLYYDDKTCPPLVARRMHRERTEQWKRQKAIQESQGDSP